MENLQQFTEAKIKEFREKFLGECPDYHDPITHQNFPSVWKEKMLNIADIESFLTQSFTECSQATADAVKGEKGIKWMIEGHNKSRKGYTEIHNEIISAIASKEKEWFK